ETKIPETDVVQKQSVQNEIVSRNNIAIYPNPVTRGTFKIAFTDQPPGKYQVQLMDISGQLISKKNITINNESQVEEFRLPAFITSGSYLVKVVSQSNNSHFTEKITVQ